MGQWKDLGNRTLLYYQDAQGLSLPFGKGAPTPDPEIQQRPPTHPEGKDPILSTVSSHKIGPNQYQKY